jgi:regulatory protein
VASLARHAQSRAEVRRKLARKGHDPEEIEAALDRAVDRGYLDDAAYARSLATRRSVGRGASAIAAELRAKGITREDADAAIAGLDEGGEEEAASRVVVRMVRPGADAAELQRVVSKLIRRGFPPRTAWAVTRRAARDSQPSE